MSGADIRILLQRVDETEARLRAVIESLDARVAALETASSPCAFGGPQMTGAPITELMPTETLPAQPTSAMAFRPQSPRRRRRPIAKRSRP